MKLFLRPCLNDGSSAGNRKYKYCELRNMPSKKTVSWDLEKSN